ncbi:lisH domain-containing protein ARMC9 isoform X2 [Histomonas meleagridis]|uniref:lisH domain-containing protein ARMC9 isoform X2 n=1 Tax=Histomonas meleagridis TaxID=135588 RepID=UPI00355A92EA|nr:lisH domain-containing protein ARMC9 isoform X2 [Histomonas meleagridis]KAH0804729.1 lisH domain-containing protein ARMC9 isoform X2 [Histomonas meleagridis]
MLNCLATGDVEKFRSLWNSKWSTPPNSNAQKILFLCEVFFAVFPLHPANRVKFGDITDSLQKFKEFLDTHHSDLSQSTEFLPFYALPYIPNPSEHPSFKHIFTIKWYDELSKRLTTFLDQQLSSTQMPSLITSLNSPPDNIISSDSDLFSITLEFADALHRSLNGEPPDRDYINALYGRIGVYPGDDIKFTAITDFLPLDFKSLSRDLKNPELSAPLLKACVQRITRSPSEHAKRFFSELINGDIFDIKNDTISMLITSKNIPTRAYALRLMNILATDPPGRRYLFQNKNINQLLLPILNEDDSSDLMNCVGTLQKISLIQESKPYMIKEGILDSSLKILSDISRYSDYTNDYTSALVMNLCMRKEAIDKCIENNNNMLTILTELSSCNSTQIRSYANAALSELFIKDQRIREKAKSIGLQLVFEQMKNNSNDDQQMKNQIDYVIKAMNGEVAYNENDENVNNEEEDNIENVNSYDEVGDERWDFELEGEELLSKYVICNKKENEKEKEIANDSMKLKVEINAEK